MSMSYTLFTPGNYLRIDLSRASGRGRRDWPGIRPPPPQSDLFRTGIRKVRPAKEPPKEENHPLVLDRKIGLVLIALTGFFYALTFSYPPETMSFPRFLLYIFGLLSLLLLLFPAVPRKYDYKELFSREKILTLVGAAVYVSLLQVIGFFAASFLFVSLYVWGFERGAILKGDPCVPGVRGPLPILSLRSCYRFPFPRGF